MSYQLTSHAITSTGAAPVCTTRTKERFKLGSPAACLSPKLERVGCGKYRDELFQSLVMGEDWGDAASRLAALREVTPEYQVSSNRSSPN